MSGKFIQPDVEAEYERWLTKVKDESVVNTRNTVSVADVLRAHFLIVDFFAGDARGIGGVGPRDLNLLHSAVHRQWVGIGTREKWPDPMQKAATLLFGLVKDHPFHDANKRTALLIALYCLDLQGRTPKSDQTVFEDFIVDVADDQLNRYARFEDLVRKENDPEVLFIADFLKRNSREIDKRPYTATYHEINQILKGFGFELVNPNGNYIDLVRVTHTKRLLGLGALRRKETWLAQVGFPGWKKQIGRDALGTLRKAAELIPERGYDSKVFFDGVDPLTALISQYEGPLRRLAHR